MSTLFDRYELGDLTLPNRVVMAPMTRVRAAAGGLATASMATYYAQRASAGLIVSEGVQPNAIGQSNPGTPGLHTDEQVASWRQVTDAVHVNGGRIFAQLMHGGRVSHPETTGYQPVGPSAVPAAGDVFTPTGPQPAPVPRALELHEIPEQARSYADAARRGIEAGFDGVELREQYLALLEALAPLGLAYVHLEATTDEELLVELRRAWPGTLVMNPVFPLGPKIADRASADHWLGLGADLISFGRSFISNPDLVERLRAGHPVAPFDEATYYMGGDEGYISYPTYAHAS